MAWGAGASKNFDTCDDQDNKSRAASTNFDKFDRITSQNTLLHFSFFASGISAVIYQLVWQRDLFRLFGVNIESVTTVITAFMLGLGCGGLLGSWLSSRKSSEPLLFFALMEATIAAFGLESLPIFDWVGSLVRDGSLTVRTLAAIAVLLPPTCCMGATLPLLVGDTVRKSANVGAATGRLYYINTFGAVVGCLVSALCLFPFLGVAASLRIAASLNLAASLGAGIAFVRFAGTERIDTAAEAAAPTPGAGRPVAYPLALILAGASGYVALSYEIFFLHVASFASGGNAVVIVVLLAAILLGIASGARTVGDRATAGGAVPDGLFSTLIWASVAGLIALPVMAHGNILKGSLVFALMPMAFMIAKALGMVFPLVAHLAVRPDEKAGFRVGLVYTMNILGSTAGTLLTGFVLSQAFGLRGLAILLSAFTLCLAFLLAAATGSLRRRRPTASLAAGLAAAGILLASQGPLTTGLFESMLFKVDPGDSGTLREVIENRSGIVAVTRDGTVYGGGVYDGVFNIDPYGDVNGIIRPYSLSLFHANPAKALMIGLASGSWAQVIANNPAVRHLTIIEINPGYTALVRRTPIVASLLDNPKVTLIVDDGHRWLESHPEDKFDAIVANSTYHFRTNAANLLSVEFDRLIRRHLSPGGLYVFNATGSIRALRTGCLSFDYGYRLLNNVVLSDRPIELDLTRWRDILESYEIDGRRMFPTGTQAESAAFEHALALPSELRDQTIAPADRRLESCASVVERTPALAPITDDNMGTEWRYPLLHTE